MALPRFYCPADLAPRTEIELPQAVAHHALRVLRLREGQPVALFDGRGGQYPATLRIQGQRALALTGEFDPRETELPGAITLVQGLPAGEKMDWVIEKAVEMGVSHIVPIAARRSVLALEGARLEKRLARWRSQAVAACEQSGRNRIPRIDAPMGLAQWLAERPAGSPALLCHPDAAQTLAQALPAPDAAGFCVLVGPEGGWDEQELREAGRHGVQAVRFGTRVLRTETAGIALVAAACALLGWE
ncbi:16S rRNA (uracil(1498)-N(3))-methyltransferase [Orrella sp. JC864]|uniref:16S rRNA (uracil(1498)-N(3))-methyltransferase n=1 Tax=Orrella sp. JC864 TaxID=3120298 RepID=UPI0012BC2FAE